MKTIALTRDRYDSGYESPDIRVTGGRRPGSTTLHYHPEYIEAKGFAARTGGLDQWVLFAVQHCTVIDNHGGSGAERARMTVELAVGEPFVFLGADEALEGVWTLAERDQRRFEGEGYKPVPYDGPRVVPGYTSAGARLLQTVGAECRARGAQTVTERPASGRYEEGRVTVRVQATFDVTVTQADIDTLAQSGQSTGDDALCALAGETVRALAQDEETGEPLDHLSVSIRDTEVLP